ncbi:MAG: N-acetylglutaminylglutamine amidotransferase, partial [Gammaproteobacteria bacterium]|nr:N-acetylglutaminylglutamine amidotransferase [Gammaproteobacteria bacterium]
MCGICGILRFDTQGPDRQMIERMLVPIAKRGPDDSGLHIQGPVGLGHRRLSIIDLSAKSHQPMIDRQSGLTIVFNGSIYNYPQLRSELIALGHRFDSNGDTEVILRAYAEWGEEAVRRLIGMFAFVIWDPRDQSLF